MNETAKTTDLLGQALFPLIETAVTEGLQKQDIEKTITDKINEVVNKVPTARLEIIDLNGVKEQFDLVHYQFPTLLKMVNAGVPVLMKGEAGTAKSHNAEAVAKALKLDFYSMSVGEQSTKSDLLGYRDANGNYRTTAFRKAFENGGLFLLDEIDAGNPNVLLAINTGLSNGFIEFPDAMIHKHKDFRLVATANTFGNGSSGNYVGRNKLDKATVNRFVSIVWQLDETVEQALVANDNWLAVIREARKIAEKNLDEVLLGMRNAIYGAKLLQAEVPFDEVFEMTVLNGLSDDDCALLEKAKEKWGKALPKAKKAKGVKGEVVPEKAPEKDEAFDEFNF
jgi:hypothetical protein